MLTSDFDFNLPDELIAQAPLPRGTSRLLTVGPAGEIEHTTVSSLPAQLSPGDLLVVNNTRVIAARLFGTLSNGARIEVLLAEQRHDDDWDCLVKPGRKARPGTQIAFADHLQATVIEKRADGRHLLHFSAPPVDFLDALGHVPLPPYIKRADRPEDRESYQTVYASVSGAIAAPTAGLHFDEQLLRALRSAGVGVAELTLHVGIGTFKPVTAALVHEHRMDAERFELTPACSDRINRTREQGHRIIAVGTTVVRTLETIASKHDGEIRPGKGRTDLFITPGFRFRVVDRLLTNFHLPRSTLLMLVSAFSGRDRVLSAYREAVRKSYRFYSYGDAMLVDRGDRHSEP
ncbi:MAG: tRNA preQ1(34) S-adenosylmethionine ribosyltransferase-isomerase QueA [Acidobacteriota bacterium]|nr:tRNA preQ1(34) S-adenosylmethionine ribosyltransferase-isomerase QueA [Acidobacteriota bacterium]